MQEALEAIFFACASKVADGGAEKLGLATLHRALLDLVFRIGFVFAALVNLVGIAPSAVASMPRTEGGPAQLWL